MTSRSDYMRIRYLPGQLERARRHFIGLSREASRYGMRDEVKANLAAMKEALSELEAV